MEALGKSYEKHGLKPEDNPAKYSWVLFPNGKHYLLKKYINQVYSPVFDGDNITIDFGEINTEVSGAVEEFLLTVKKPEETEKGFVISGDSAKILITAIVKMLLILLHYEWDAEYKKVSLTFSPAQYSELIRNVLIHIFGG